MKVLITGADGYIGRALARRLAAPGTLLQGRPVERLVLSDLALGDPLLRDAPGVTAVPGSIADSRVIDLVTRDAPDVVFHLVSVPSGQTEADPDLGLQVNVQATLALARALRRSGQAATFVFTSSIAVYGTPLPERIDDDTPLAPALSYGAHKQMAEIFLADATRRGHLQARMLRLPGVVARPPTPTGALSAFSSELMRALVAHRPYVCPVSPQATLWLLSLQACIDNLLHAAQCPAQPFGGTTALNLPAQHVSVARLVDAFETVSPGASAGISYQPQAGLEAQFGRLPPLFTARADAAGFRHDGNLATLVQRVRAGLAE
ncbi:NAD-dependent epimerase/dehydratase family protein [Aquincola tertiaricarbonis]|uniref:NAD-dependent epimerase/dehydratase family protein n=1 Tax=Aquincola tertiaricarbonis TaxID=391953 RepID=A0ABY4S6F4_AQUTE|nr:NAD-dependent epimerase/dehydratase family protein [Aquincola tertiaricarbonis]URI08569.1 NAD-dependent epimerase/dehydratase family protein [Aquincola tertiaricarbonis]